ncbi:MAG: hypothetical protein GY720_12925 [bacterium]|nr:hypothetical protein [bacterium]
MPPAPFPIPANTAVATAGSQGAGTLDTLPADLLAADPDVSSIVRLDVGESIWAAAQHQPATRPYAGTAAAAIGAIRYAAPAWALLAGFVLISGLLNRYLFARFRS